MQFMLFECEVEELDAVLKGLASFATLKEGTAFYFYSELPGRPAFTFDCELISGGLITSRSGDCHSFLGRVVEALTSKFGALEIGPDGALPVPAADTRERRGA
jgi:hypothetical protein